MPKLITISALLSLYLILAQLAFAQEKLVSPILSNSEFIGQNLLEGAEKSGDILMNIPLITQSRNLSCEATSIKMVLSYYGEKIDEDTIQNSFNKNSNPNLGFRGNVDGSIWGFKDYGIYADMVAKIMAKFGVSSHSYKNISQTFLKTRVMSGKPAIIWVNVSNPNPKVENILINGSWVKLISGEHTVVVTGYENGYWILNDPWRRTVSGQKVSERLKVRDLNEIMWSDFDNMAVIVD